MITIAKCAEAVTDIIHFCSKCPKNKHKNSILFSFSLSFFLYLLISYFFPFPHTTRAVDATTVAPVNAAAVRNQISHAITASH